MSGVEHGGELVRKLKVRRDELRHAIMFLTRLPVGQIASLPSLGRSMWAYPIVGALHGLVIGLSYSAAHLLGLSSLICALLAVMAGLVASGAFHEDGLADCADGFGGGWTRERKLEIMRDSRIGTYGTVALIITLGLKVALLTEIADAYDVLYAAVGLGALTRGIIPLAMMWLPAARADGTAAETAGTLSSVIVGVSVAVGLTFAFGMLAPSAVLVIVAVFGGMGLMFMIAMRQIGGLTGDVLGAAQVVGEITGLLAIVVLVAP